MCKLYDDKIHLHLELYSAARNGVPGVSSKTTSDHVEKLKTEIKNNHPYDVPEIVVIKMSDVSHEYFNWMYKNTHKSDTDDV